MKDKKIYLLATAASAFGALIGALIMNAQMERATDQDGGRALWMGGFLLVPFVLSFVALQIALQFGKAYKIARPRFWWVSFLLACAIIFGIGAGGQYLFMYSKEEITTDSDVDMVLLLDVSSSMDVYGYGDARTEAASRFVDSLDDSSKLKVLAFAGNVVERTELLTMNSKNKNTLKQMINALDNIGTTDFGEPLEEAKKALEDEGRSDAQKAVILLTDGEAPLDRHIEDMYSDSDIKVFTVRISRSTSPTSMERDLIDFADGTGGVDTQLTPKSNGSIDTREMLNAFKDAFEATSETVISMSEDLIVYAEDDITFLQFVIRTAVLTLCLILAGFGFFGRIGIPSLALHCALGVITSLLIGVFEGAGYILCWIAVCLLIETAYVFLDLRGEEQHSV